MLRRGREELSGMVEAGRSMIVVVLTPCVHLSQLIKLDA